ncbi:hypothetical protein ACH47X_08730 [Promicromonospora kroppenstedtii]|uniref:Uncharacterized protein n=1 Tax=Promicromonospora kroppenstedtii TaxID=440482 RepID=A0ABW7XIH0_9MICO
MTVAAQRSSTNAVVVGTAPFAWRLDAYGPFAYRLDTDTEEIDEAVDGVRRALDVLPGDSGSFLVVVVAVQTSNVDTWPGDVRYAAGQALWSAVGHQRTDSRKISEGRLVFPDKSIDVTVG